MPPRRPSAFGRDSEPPVKAVVIGKRKLGEETVLYRHEKTFVNKPILAVNIDDDAPDALKTLEGIKNYRLERVGEVLILEAVAITQKSGDDAKYAALVKQANEVTGLPVVLRARPEALAAAVPAVKGTNSVICGANAENAESLAALAKENGCSLAVAGKDLDDTAAITARLKEKGFNELYCSTRPIRWPSSTRRTPSRAGRPSRTR